MKTHYLYLLFGLMVAACGTDGKRLPEASGAQGEVLVVMDKGHWESEPGALVRAILEQPIPTLPQREPRFKLVQCAPQNFGSLLRTHHAVLFAAIGTPDDTATTRPLHDRFARGQMVMQIAGVDGAAWAKAFAAEADGLVGLYERHQLDRIRRQLVKERDPGTISSVERNHGVALDIPGGYRIMEQDSTFTWLQRDRMVSGSGMEHNVIEGILIHHHPYTSDTVFNVNPLIDMRDAVTRAHVEGPAPGSYMIVQRRFESIDLMPQGMKTQVDGRYAFLMHGLFGMEGAKMGGPFVSLTTVCESEGRLITVEGFVYAPQFNKREYVREMEALIFSLTLPKDCTPLNAKQ